MHQAADLLEHRGTSISFLLSFLRSLAQSKDSGTRLPLTVTYAIQGIRACIREPCENLIGVKAEVQEHSDQCQLVLGTY